MKLEDMKVGSVVQEWIDSGSLYIFYIKTQIYALNLEWDYAYDVWLNAEIDSEIEKAAYNAWVQLDKTILEYQNILEEKENGRPY